MKKIIALLLLMPFLSGCMVFNCWVIKGDGKDVTGGYKLATGEARRIDAIGLRYLLITDQKIDKKFLEEMPIIKIIVDNDNKTKTVEVGPEVNFTHK